MPSPTRSLEYIEPAAQPGAGHELSRFPLTDERVSRLWEEVQHGGAARLPREGVCSMSTSQVRYLYFYLYFCLFLYLYFHEKGCGEGRPHLYLYLNFCLYLYLYFHEKGCVEGRLTLNQDCLSSLHNLIYCLVFISLV